MARTTSYLYGIGKGQVESMGFLRSREGVERWLRRSAAGFAPLADREYREVARVWRAAFEPALMAGNRVRGREAVDAMVRALPLDVYVFNLPGYRWLPAATDARYDQSFGYRVSLLAAVDLSAANDADAIIARQDMKFALLCTHESGAFAEPEFVQAESW